MKKLKNNFFNWNSDLQKLHVSLKSSINDYYENKDKYINNFESKSQID